MEYELVEITWIDAWSDQAHLQIEAIASLNPITRKSVGFLIASDNKKLILTSGLIDNEFAGKTFVDGIFVIPRGMMVGEPMHLERFDPKPIGVAVADHDQLV